MSHVAFPYRIDALGRTAGCRAEDHVRSMVESVLCVSPGERVMNVSFGCGLGAMTFEGISEEIAAATQFLIESGLQQWLGHLIALDAVDVSAQDATLVVRVRYVVRRTRETRDDEFTVERAA